MDTRLQGKPEKSDGRKRKNGRGNFIYSGKLCKDLNMAMVSNHICMNYSLFSAAFKEHTGVNFVNYLKEIRIAEAKRLLIQTEDKITEIAKQVGFENDKHFMKSFKTACGVSPSEFRKDYKMVSNGKGGQDE